MLLICIILFTQWSLSCGQSKVHFSQPSDMDPISDLEAYTKMLGACGRDVGCTGVKEDENGEWVIVYGDPPSDGTITAVKVCCFILDFESFGFRFKHNQSIIWC